MATIKELQSQIEKLDASLSKLATKAEAVNAEMSSGNWGVAQIREMEAALKSLNAQMTSKTTKKMKLVDEASLRDFDILNKRIATTEEKLLNLGGLKSIKIDPNGVKEFNDHLLATQKRIKNLETSLASLNSQKFNLFDAQGYRKTGADVAAFDDVDLNARSTPREEARIAAARKAAAIPTYNAEMAKYSAGVTGAKDAETAAALQKFLAIVDNAQLAVQKEFRESAAKLNAQIAGTTSHIPGGFDLNAGGGYGNKPYGPELPPPPLTGADKKKAEAAAVEKIRKAWLDANEAHKAYVRGQGINDPDKAYQVRLLASNR